MQFVDDSKMNFYMKNFLKICKGATHPRWLIYPGVVEAYCFCTEPIFRPVWLFAGLNRDWRDHSGRRGSGPDKIKHKLGFLRC